MSTYMCLEKRYNYTPNKLNINDATTFNVYIFLANYYKLNTP